MKKSKKQTLKPLDLVSMWIDYSDENKNLTPRQIVFFTKDNRMVTLKIFRQEKILHSERFGFFHKFFFLPNESNEIYS